MDPIDADFVLAATLSQDWLMPNAAPVVARALIAERAGAIGVGAGCTGCLSGGSLACGADRGGPCERVLVIGAEILTGLTNERTARPRRCGAMAAARCCSAARLPARGPIAPDADGALVDVIVESDHLSRLRASRRRVRRRSCPRSKPAASGRRIDAADAAASGPR